jgi:hypothetical protein
MRILSSNQLNFESKTETKQKRTIYTYSMQKTGLNAMYNKRIVLEDGISTVPLKI